MYRYLMALANTRLFTVCAYLIFAGVAAALVIGHTPYGAAMSMDSLYYLSAAQQMSLGHGIALPDYAIGDRDISPMTTWPPLYAVFLQLLIPADSVFGVDAGKFVLWFNIVGLACTLSIFWALAGRLIPKVPAFVVTLLLALVPSMQIIYMYAWSETLSVPVVLAAAWFFARFLDPQADHRLRSLTLSVACLALGFHLRYAVLGFVAGLCASILLLDSSNLKQRIKLVAGSAVWFAALVAPLLLRNFWLANNFIGKRGASDALLAADMNKLAGLLASEVFYGFWPLPLVLGMLLVGVIVVIIRKRREIENPAEHGFRLALAMLIWAVAYLIFLIISRQMSMIDLDTRMIAPIVPFMMLAALGLLSGSRQVIDSGLIEGLSALLLLSTAANGYLVHREIVASWQSARTPGTLLGITYNSISSPSFATYYRLRELIRAPGGTLVLTDLDRPVMLHYFFPAARVKQLPGDITEDGLRALKPMLGKQGFVVITKDQTASAFTAATKANAAFQQVVDANGQPMIGLLVLHLPVTLTP